MNSASPSVATAPPAVAAPSDAALPGPHREVKGDVSGRDRMAWNVLTSWGAHVIFVISGFIMPRLIDHEVGQRALGIWDFGWSLVSYFELAQVGIGSSGNRFVAKYRAVHDTAGLNRAISTMTAIQIVAGLVVAVATAVMVYVLPGWFGD